MNIDANVQKILLALIKKWKLLIICLLIGALMGYLYTANFTTLTYTSSVEFLANSVDKNDELSESTGTTASGEQVRISNTSRMNYAMKMLNTYIEIMKTNDFNEMLADDLNKSINSNYSAALMKSSMSFEKIEDTTMFKIVVTTLDADLSYEIAHQLEKTVPKMMKQNNNGLVQATVQDKAVKATSAESLGYPKKCAIGAAAGLVLAAAYIILRNLLDVRIKTSQELVEKYNIPVLGSIPDFSNSTGSKKKGGRK